MWGGVKQVLQSNRTSRYADPRYNPWKDVIIPGYVDTWRCKELKANNKKVE